MDNSSSEERVSLLRALGPGMAVAIVVGNVIGSGIFATPGGIAADGLGFPLIISAWITGGAFPVAWDLRQQWAAGSGVGQRFQNWYQYSSEHVGMVQFAYADGSVKQVNVAIDPGSLRLGSGMRDGDRNGNFRPDRDALGF